MKRLLQMRRILLPLLFIVACACALWVTLWMPSRGTSSAPGTCCCCESKCDADESPRFAVRWRVPFAARPAPPCAAGEGWIVADEAGGVTALGHDGAVRWRAAFSNQVFEAAAAVSDGIAIVASRKGEVIALRLEDGRTIWSRTTEGLFLRAPPVGVVNHEPVVWLMSQADGQLFCLRMRDGAVIWSGEPTNRCDGEPVMWQGRIAYGNCDGAVYLFDAATGAAHGKIEVGADDQMAGGLLALPDGRLIGGTRQGHLVAVDPVALKLVARTVVAQSEAFATPVMTSDGEIATGTPEGEVVFCRLDGDALQVTGRVTLGTSEAGELVSTDDGIFALCGGELCVVAPEQRTVKRIALGDDAYGLAVDAHGAIVCVADQSLVCVEGGGQ